MKQHFADLHIHIGRTYTGKAVKITGAKTLTFSNIVEHARNIKGLDIVGIIDCHSPEVLDEMEARCASGDLVEAEGGGLLHGDFLIIPGSELEIYDESCQGPIHVLAYFPTLAKMREFSNWLRNHLKNIQLSSQRVYITGRELQKQVKLLDGLFIPAHVFTPFKSLYGKGVKRSLTEVFDPELIDGIELGLSSDTSMADQIEELHQYPFITNSDAHSLGKIAREYQIFQLEKLSFQNIREALQNENGQTIVENYGLDPLLGKYHESVCAKCFEPVTDEDEAVCASCGHHRIVKGVAARILELKMATDHVQIKRPPYIHQVPLDFIPGLGPKLFSHLLQHFGTEMAVLHHVPEQSLRAVVPAAVAERILLARKGKLSLQAGGGGKFGKIT